MTVELAVGGAYPLLDDVLKLINILGFSFFGDGVDPNIHYGQCNVGWFKLPVHTNFLDVEVALVVVNLDLFDCFDNRIDLMVLCHRIFNEIDVMAECDEERGTSL